MMEAETKDSGKLAKKRESTRTNESLRSDAMKPSSTPSGTPSMIIPAHIAQAIFVVAPAGAADVSRDVVVMRCSVTKVPRGRDDAMFGGTGNFVPRRAEVPMNVKRRRRAVLLPWEE